MSRLLARAILKTTCSIYSKFIINMQVGLRKVGYYHHPGRFLGSPGQSGEVGRNQLVFNISRPAQPSPPPKKKYRKYYGENCKMTSDPKCHQKRLTPENQIWLENQIGMSGGKIVNRQQKKKKKREKATRHAVRPMRFFFSLVSLGI